jgi:hypothetical protein
MPIHRSQQRVNIDKRLLGDPGQQLAAPSQGDEMVAQHGLELSGMPEGELPQQRSQR